MNPVIGQIIVIAVIAALAFVCGRVVLKDIKSELKGEGTCAGCSGSCHGGSGCGGDAMECAACMKHMEELKKIAEARQK